MTKEQDIPDDQHGVKVQDSPAKPSPDDPHIKVDLTPPSGLSKP